MQRNNLKKIIEDYRMQSDVIDFNLSMLEQQMKALKTRQKFIKRKIIILNSKYEKTKGDTINFSCNDFDDIDMLF